MNLGDQGIELGERYGSVVNIRPMSDLGNNLRSALSIFK